MVVSKSHVCTGHFPAYASSLPASALSHLEQQLDWNEIPLCILVHLMQERGVEVTYAVWESTGVVRDCCGVLKLSVRLGC